MNIDNKLRAFKEDLNQLYKKHGLALDTDGSNQNMYIVTEEKLVIVSFNNGYRFFERGELTPQGREYKEI